MKFPSPEIDPSPRRPVPVWHPSFLALEAEFSDPGPSEVLILLRQVAPLNLNSLPARSTAPRGVGYYNLPKLLSSNRLEPVSWNYMYVTGTGPPAWKKALKRKRHGKRSRG